MPVQSKMATSVQECKEISKIFYSRRFLIKVYKILAQKNKYRLYTVTVLGDRRGQCSTRMVQVYWKMQMRVLLRTVGVVCRWVVFFFPFSYFQPKQVQKVSLGGKPSCWQGTDEQVAGSSARVPQVCSLHRRTSNTCPKQQLFHHSESGTCEFSQPFSSKAANIKKNPHKQMHRNQLWR